MVGGHYPRSTRPKVRKGRRTSLVKKNASRFRRRGGAKKAILSNSHMIQRLYKTQIASRIYTDWRLTSTTAVASGAMGGVCLVDPAGWTSVLRMDPNVQFKQTTYLSHMTLNIQTYCPPSSGSITWNIFLCTLRKNFSDIDPLTLPLIEPNDYIVGLPHGRVFLNQGVFKVMRQLYYTISPTVMDGVAVDTATKTLGDPSDTWRRSQMNVSLKFPLSFRRDKPWKDLHVAAIPYYQRIYLLAYPVTGVAAVESVFQYQALFTCVNSD